MELIQSKIDKLIENFNSLPSEENKKRNSFSADYSSEYIQKQLEKWREEKNNSFRAEAAGMLGTNSAKITNLSLKVPKAKFPLRFSVSDFEKIIGELKYQRAANFLNTVKESENILNELTNSIAVDDKDYVSSLLDILESTKPNDIQLSQLPNDKQKFYRDFEKIKKEYETKLQISDVSDSLNTLKIFQAEIQFILESITENSSMILLPRTFVKLPQKEQVDLVPFANKSLEFLSKKGVIKTNFF